ncbi:PAP2 superfamily protein [Oceanospirillum multiglobuliferum]|uniref:Phosphatidic acid phosphatase type 2/haloperoxidase domain-containing protein n=1 Tax=Oceanospirillum multiglobuliferum TaxID=64969 RepID=A0A1T4NRF0_9GAMM|nr:phosphatase PAP2 family protein [Oceanospirillum multiglobuliferum]OPX55704.1 hypothetical protein BTE48_07355 [Oceanospirillum multiglobuliferum]SJZ81686.1 PAP2 superfamily protein [Oceanospirillum multiglobuliferum]
MLKKLSLLLVSLCLSTSLWAGESFSSDLSKGYSNFYNQDNLPWLGATYLAGGILANTSLDRDIQDEYNRRFHSQATDDFAAIAKKTGDQSTAFVFLGIAALNRLACNQNCGAVAEWGDRTAQALLVGLPAVWGSQMLLGGNRPHRGKSDWTPLQFDTFNGVSGHAFTGAVPFLTAAAMTDNTYAKGMFYGLSTLTAWSRLNDQKHYFSQIMMGWLFAAKVTGAVNMDIGSNQAMLLPYADDKTVALTFIQPF